MAAQFGPRIAYCQQISFGLDVRYWRGMELSLIDSGIRGGTERTRIPPGWRDIEGFLQHQSQWNQTHY